VTDIAKKLLLLRLRAKAPNLEDPLRLVTSVSIYLGIVWWQQPQQQPDPTCQLGSGGKRSPVQCRVLHKTVPQARLAFSVDRQNSHL